MSKGVLVLLILLCPVLVSAGEMTVGGGVIHPQYLSDRPSLMLGYQWYFAKRFTLGPEFSYWQFSTTDVCVTSDCSGFMKRTDTTLGLNAGVMFPFEKFSLFASTGIATHFLHGTDRITLGSLGEHADEFSQTKAGFHLGGGAQYDWSRAFGFFMSERYEWIKESDNNFRTYAGMHFRF